MPRHEVAPNLTVSVPHHRSKIHVLLVKSFQWGTTNYWCAVKVTAYSTVEGNTMVAQFAGCLCCSLVHPVTEYLRSTSVRVGAKYQPLPIAS